ncbi:Uncharacterised protein [Mycobacteroides abscessus subsp. abscessus]|nr:Uncharacterised protein [Mycobacteroides abscessus subsp. abscessus]
MVILAQFGEEDLPRIVIPTNVVHDQQDHEVFCTEPQQRDPERPIGSQVEGPPELTVRQSPDLPVLGIARQVR